MSNPRTPAAEIYRVFRMASRAICHLRPGCNGAASAALALAADRSVTLPPAESGCERRSHTLIAGWDGRTLGCRSGILARPIAGGLARTACGWSRPRHTFITC